MHTVPAQAQRSEPVREVAAALALAQAGVRAEKASLILTGLEVFASHAPIGDVALQLWSQYTSEARFFLRGDMAQQARLDALQRKVLAGSGAPFILISPYQDSIDVPPGLRVKAVTATSDVILHAVQGAPGQICQNRPGLWHCGFVPAQSRLDLEGEAVAPAWIVLELAPATP